MLTPKQFAKFVQENKINLTCIRGKVFPRRKELFVHERNTIFIFDELYKLWRNERDMTDTIKPNDMLNLHYEVVP